MAHLEAAKKWFAKASRDLRTAKALIELNDPDLEMTAFAAQQCAEKAIKGFLTFHGKRIPKIHDMKALIDLVITINSSLHTVLSKSVRLTPFAVKVRYPDATDLPDISEGMAKEAIEISEHVFSRLKEILDT